MQKQILTITVVFNQQHSPGTDHHLAQILYNYLKSKGVKFNLRDNTIEV